MASKTTARLFSISIAILAAAALARADQATINLNPAQAYAGDPIIVSGTVTPGSAGVRILWTDRGKSTTVTEGPVDSSGRFSFSFTTPGDASPSTVQICAMAMGPNAFGYDRACKQFVVMPPPPLDICGELRAVNTSGQTVPLLRAPLRLLDEHGGPIAETLTSENGNFCFSDLTRMGNYRVIGLADGFIFPETNVHLTPSNGNVSIQIVGSALNPILAHVTNVLALALPHQGILKDYDYPAIVSSQSSLKDTGIISTFGSFKGHDVPGLMVRFGADVQFVTPEDQGRKVRFQVLDPKGNELWGVTKDHMETFYPEAPLNYDAYISTVIFFDMDVSTFPPGDLTLRITPITAGFETGVWEAKIRMLDLGNRWFAPWIQNPQVTADGDFLGVHYDYQGTVNLPGPGSDPLSLPIPVVIHTFKNELQTTATVQEHFLAGPGTIPSGPGGTFHQKIVMLDATVLDYDFPLTPVPGLYGLADRWEAGNYIVDLGKLTVPLYRAGPGIGCVDLYFTEICAGWKLWVDLVLSGQFTLAGKVDSQIACEIDGDTSITGAIGGHFTAKAGAGIFGCSASANVVGSATLYLPFTAHGAPSIWGGFHDPCVSVYASADASIGCFGAAIGGSGDLGPYSWGCDRKHRNDATPTVETGHFAVDPWPSVAADGAGDAIVVWTGEADDGTPLIFASVWSNGAWGDPTIVSATDRLVSAPRVAFTGPGRAIAVWSQNRQPWVDVQAAGQADLQQQEIAYSTFADGAWSTAALVTRDARPDGMAGLGADPIHGRALAAWVRGLDDGAGGVRLALVASQFDGASWSTPTEVAPATGVYDSDAAVTFDADGNAWAAWTRDQDGDLETYADRAILVARFDGTTWGAPESVTGLPVGSFGPAITIDRRGRPLLAFSIPPTDDQGQPTSGIGSHSSLGWALRDAGNWSDGVAVDGTYAEAPAVAVDGENRATIVFRSFADGGTVSGELAAVVADLDASPIDWSGTDLTANDDVDWKAAVAIDPANDESFVASVAETPSVPVKTYVSGPKRSFRAAQSGSTVNAMHLAHLPDLVPVAISFSDSHPIFGDTITISTRIRNAGPATLGSGLGTVAFYDGDPAAGGAKIAEKQIAAPLAFGDEVTLSTTFVVKPGGLHSIYVVADPAGAVAELDESNDTLSAELGLVPVITDLVAVPSLDRQHVELTWTDPDPGAVTLFKIFRTTTPGSGYELVGETPTVGFVDPPVHRDATFAYVVTCIDPYGVPSGVSNEATVRLEPTVTDADGRGSTGIGPGLE